ncbi:MAG: conjugal transfer protein TraG [Bifidobacterium dentium]|nr:MAG: conjugal transfer protein TraG [Bifidobacterium dentium]
MKRIRGIIIRALAILAGFWLADLAAARIQAGIAAGRTAQQIMDDMTTMPRHPLMLGFDRTSLLCGLAGAAAAGLFLLYRWSMGQRNWRDGEEYGSARWSKPEEMAPYTDGDISENLQMTRTEGLSLDTRATRRNLNTTVLGGSGSGKTATHVIPNILKASMDYACTDPKGELYGMTHETLRRQGYEVRKLDLVDLTCETRFNPMQYIDPAKPDVSIMRLVTNIMDNTNGSTPKEHQTDDFWAKSERSLLTALTAFVYYLPDDILRDCLHIDAGQTLNAVADMRDLLESSEQDETRESPVDAVARTAMEIYEETRAEWDRKGADHDDPDLREAWRLAQGLKFAARQYRPFTQGAGETKKGIIISLGVRLAPLTVGPVREILSGDDIGIGRIGGYRDEHEGGYQHPTGRIAIFLALPDEDPTFNFLAAIFYQCLFDSIIRRCRTYPGECLSIPLHCFLDEFANVGRIPNFDRLIATIRSRRVSVSVILQTIAQLKTMYRDSWETIVGNCDSVLFLGGNEQSTTEWLSKLLGKETIDLRTTSDSKGVSGSHTINYQRAGRELLTPDELAQLDNDKCIYNLRGLHPFLSRKAWPGTTIARPKSTLKHSKGWKTVA